MGAGCSLHGLRRDAAEPESCLNNHDFHKIELWNHQHIASGTTGKVFDGKTTPKPLPIASARIRIWNGDDTYVDEKKAVEPDADGVVFTLANIPAGPAFV